MVTGSRINLNLSLVRKTGVLLTSVQNVMEIISLDNYYKIVLLDDKNCYRFSVITSTQATINARGKSYSVSDAKIWSFWKAANWQTKHFPGGITANEYIHKFKLEWIRSYKEVIKAASDYYNLPVLVLAGVMYVEAGGQPPIADATVYYLRDTFYPKVVNGIASLPYMSRLKGEAIKTSFGDISMQIRVAAEVLDYPNPNILSEAERDAIIESLKTAEIGLFICAKHLSALKNVDYPHLTKNQLTDNHIRIITTRYNVGASATLAYIQNNTVYGDRILKNKSAINEAVK